MTQFQILSKLVPRHSYTPAILYPDGKNCAVPVLHRDFFLAKVEALWPVLRQVTPTKFYCRAVRGKLSHNELTNYSEITKNLLKNSNTHSGTFVCPAAQANPSQPKEPESLPSHEIIDIFEHNTI